VRLRKGSVFLFEVTVAGVGCLLKRGAAVDAQGVVLGCVLLVLPGWVSAALAVGSQ
jgi:hypothetical protein